MANQSESSVEELLSVDESEVGPQQDNPGGKYPLTWLSYFIEILILFIYNWIFIFSEGKKKK